MQWMKWLSVAAALLLISSCFFSWIIIPGKEIIVSGVKAEGTNYGKPGYLNIFFTVVYIMLTLVPRLWAKRVNIFIATLNLAWSLRNFIILSHCEGGICPERQTAFYIFFLASFLMFTGSLLTSPGKSFQPKPETD